MIDDDGPAMTQPWTTEPNNIDFEAHGLPCRMRRGPVGSWNGYVGVPKGHPLHAVSYSDVDYERIDVHGGLSPDLGFTAPDDVYRNERYVRTECECLAKQLSEWATKETPDE